MGKVNELLERYLDRYFSDFDLLSIIELYNRNTNSNLNIDDIDASQIARMKFNFIKYGIDLNNNDMEAFDFVFMYYLSNVNVSCEFLLQILTMDKMMPMHFLELIRDYTYNIECMENVFDLMNDLIVQVQRYFEKQPETYLDELIMTFEKLKNEDIIFSINFDLYFEENVDNKVNIKMINTNKTNNSNLSNLTLNNMNSNSNSNLNSLNNSYDEYAEEVEYQSKKSNDSNAAIKANQYVSNNSIKGY